MAARILKGNIDPPEDASMGMGEYFFEAAQKYADNIFQIDADTEESETYSRVKQRAVRVALYLQKSGIKPGDVIMPFCKNNLDSIVPVLVGLFLGCPVSSLDMKLNLFDIKYCIDVARPKIIFVVEEKIDVLETALKELEFETQIVVIGDFISKYPKMYDIEKEYVEEEENFKPFKVKDTKKEIAFILFSSGTSNMPKGIMISHLTAMHFGMTIKKPMEEYQFKPSSKNLRPVSFYWISSVWSLGIMSISGTTTVLMKPFSLGRDLEIAVKYKITNIFLVTPKYTRLLDGNYFEKFDLSALKGIAVGGAPVSGDDILELRKRLPDIKVTKVYGATEIGTSPIGWNNVDINSVYYKSKFESCGVVIWKNTEVKVVDTETRELLGPNKSGELLIKSPYQTMGYYNKPTATDLFDKDGFLCTGDLGYYDNDGFVYVTDRISETFRYRGFKIFPTVIENQLMKLPAIKEVVIVRVPHRIEENHIGACIVLNDGFTISEDEIQQFINEQMGDIYALRAGIKIVKEMPLTPTGKFKRRAVKDMFQ